MARQKYLIVPSQSFSKDVKTNTTAGVSARTGKSVVRDVQFSDLPWVVQKFYETAKGDCTTIVDEISWFHSTAAMPENKKSGRCRALKLLHKFSKVMIGLTGTLLTKSPVNIKDPYDILAPSAFAHTNDYSIMENHSVVMALRAARGRRVMISQKEWDKARRRMINSYNFGGEAILAEAKQKLNNELGLKAGDAEHILTNRKFTPFRDIDKLKAQVAKMTYVVQRKDIFDVAFDKKVYDPIMRPVKLEGKGLQIAKELINVGFTDNLVLGRAPALELMHRLKDICNGFEPIKEHVENEDEQVPVRYEALPSNPKLEGLKDLLAEIGTEDNQVIVWCDRRNAMDSVQAMLEVEQIPYVTYRGGMSDAEKAEAARKMRSGEARVFVGNPAAAAFGLNFLAKVDYMIWYSVDGSVERYHQAQHRILRGQSQTAKFAYMLYVKGSVEERNMRSVNAGVELLSASNTKDVFAFIA